MLAALGERSRPDERTARAADDEIAFAYACVPVAPAFRLDATNLDEAHPALASSGDQVLAMWESEEPEPPIWTVRGTRFDANGAVLGTERFVIAVNARAPEAAFDGTNYVVVWIHNGVAGGTSLDVRAARVASDGTVLDPDGITLAATVRRENEQSVACGGGVCLVVWREGPVNVRAARLAPDGTVLDPGGVVVGQVVGADRATAVTFDGQSFVVGWRTDEGSEIRGVQMSPDGAVLPPGEILLAASDSPADNPALGSTGAGSAVLLYDRFDSSPPWRVRRLRARSIGGLAGWPDAGPPSDVDAAPPPPDAASPDAASLPDAALPDAAPLPDASTPDDASSPPPDAAGHTDTDSGGCQTASGTGTRFAWLLVAAGCWLDGAGAAAEARLRPPAIVSARANVAGIRGTRTYFPGSNDAVHGAGSWRASSITQAWWTV